MKKRLLSVLLVMTMLADPFTLTAAAEDIEFTDGMMIEEAETMFSDAVQENNTETADTALTESSEMSDTESENITKSETVSEETSESVTESDLNVEKEDGIRLGDKELLLGVIICKSIWI